MKSSCCGDVCVLSRGTTKYYTCGKCLLPTNSIRYDMMSKVEILRWMDNWIENGPVIKIHVDELAHVRNSLKDLL